AIFTQPRLADTFEQLARAGLDDFYVGELARHVAADLAAAGSPVSLEDLQTHRAVRRKPLTLSLTQGQLFNMPPPTQGVVAMIILGLMDRLGASRFDHLSPEY